MEILILVTVASILIVGITAQFQIEATLSNVEYLDPKTGRTFRVAKVFGQEVEVKS